MQPAWITTNGLFAVTINNREHYVNFAHSPLNSHVNSSLARNKYLTRRILERHALPNIPYMWPRTLFEAHLFLREHITIIAKPLRGSGSRDIHIVTTAEQLKELSITRYILERYVTGKEFRYLILNDKVIAVHRSEYGVAVDANRHLERISYPQQAWDISLVDTSLRTVRALGLNFAAVDYLVNQEGDAYILEVNTAPGLKWFHAPSSGPSVDAASQFLVAMLENEKGEHSGTFGRAFA